MMVKSCCVVGCKGPSTPNPVFFQFPSSRLLRKRWLDAIKCSNAAEEATVCIRHFSRADYQLVRGEATLRSRSVPSRRIGESDDEDSESGSDSSESTESDTSRDKNNSKHKDNKDNGKINNDNQTNEENTQMENGPLGANTENNDNRLDNENNGTINDDNGKTSDVNGQTNDENKETNGENKKISTEKSKLTYSYGKLNFDFGTDKKADGKTDKDGGQISDNGKMEDDNGKMEDDNGKMKDDNGKMNSDSGNNNRIQGRKTRCKITAMRAINGRRKPSFSSDSTNSDSVSSSPRRELDGKVDIEESLQHYYIENKKTERQVAAMTDVIHEPQEQKSVESGVFEPSDPVFIELSVGHAGAGREGQAGEPPEADCLMLLESVQCDVDPALLLAAREEEEENMEQVDLGDDDDDEPVVVEKKKEDPISLLTSSDEDDVIIQEPKYDLVEVSSADTSEDDMPLVKLVKPPALESIEKKLTSKHTKKLITKLLWGRKDFYCVHCRFTTVNASEYTKHMAIHNLTQSQHKIIQYCQECGFTTSSKNQMQKHKQKHKNEKRFKCPKCNYSAKHEMSLVYHMKTHKNSGLNEVELAICGTYEPTGEKRGKKKSKLSRVSGVSKVSERSRVSESEKRYKCGNCKYRTDRRSDLKRHRKRLHDADEDDDDDEEYVP